MDSLESLLSSARAAHASPGRAHVLAGQAVAMARQASAGDALLGQACLLQATYSYRLFNYVDSYVLALEASELLGRCGDHKRRARAVNLCFIINIETGELIRALDCVRRALTDARRRGDLREQARLLLNQAVVFDITEEYDAAVRCLDEAIELLTRLDNAEHELFFTRVNLAEVHMGHAERLQADGGSHGQALAFRVRAAEILPDFRPDAPLAALNTWISLKSRLGDIAQARSAAACYLQRLRSAGHGKRYRTYALLALGEYHVQAGRPDKGAQRLKRAIEIMRGAENRSHLGQTEQRLARLFAAEGNHAQALQWQRMARQDDMRLHGEQQNLRWRLAALEREAEARRAQRHELLIHTQRLAVIGRLLSEIYHALAEPIMHTQRILAGCVERFDAGEAMPATLLQQVIEQIDAASALVRQLKMFSYRAAPQSMELALGVAVVEAWEGMVLWRRGAAVPMQVVGERAALVQVDAQRLAVLLRILLIEADRAGPTDTIQVEIARHDDGVRLQLRCQRGSRVAMATGSVGVTLCAEIAQEMGGHLMRSATPAGVLCFELQLPAARVQAEEQVG
jgi:tetratricopeptide (TPR) repeat protein